MTIRLGRGPVVVATHNSGKVREIVDLLAPFGVEVKLATELSLIEPDETGATFAENAVLKARAAAVASGLPALADDSGLAVDALDGAPGVHSARWAGPSRDFSVAMRKVEERLREADALTPARRRAHFIAVLAFATQYGTVETFEGRVDGTLVFPPRGDKGFGYDPIFRPDGHSRTFGEMSKEEKHGRHGALSHRARAFQLFAARVLQAQP